MDWWRRLERRFTERVILVAGWLLFLLYAYPGYMSYDSTWQLSQARGLERLSDWHPPMMAFIWRGLDDIVSGPILMLVLQSVTFLIGSYCIFTRAMSKRAAAVAAVVLLLLPQNIHVMAVIWKDSQMAGFVMAGVACLLSTSRRWRVIGYVLLFLATAVRYNAAAPTFPIIVLLFDRERVLPWFKRYAAACAIWLVVTASAFVVNGVITEKKSHPWPVGAASVDIYGIIYYGDVDTDKLVKWNPKVRWLHTDTNLARVRYWYKPSNSYFYAMEGDAGLFDYPKNDEEREALGALWRKLVKKYPRAYLKHRSAVFWEQLTHDVGVWYAFMPSEDRAKLLEHQASLSMIQEVWAKSLVWIEHLYIMRPLIYFALLLLLIGFARRDRLLLAMLLSGLAHEAGLFLLAPAIDYRYSHWTVVVALMGAIYLLGRRFGGRENTA